jgi:hypothetical protein
VKSRVVATVEEATRLEAHLEEAAAATVARLTCLAGEKSALRVLEALKFEQSGRDPLDPTKPLNLIEQLNQTFTYLVSLRAVELLFQEHEEAAPFRMNLGTAAGSDIESVDGSVAAEIFAAVAPDNNRKLMKDIAKVRGTQATHKYVFFYCPGEFERQIRDDVIIVPVSLERVRPH